ncbi:MAG: cystathionine gamma-lyase [Solirubrobacterales bacterium]|nr:cystathionine gamma-lyase [Solirubrobacterales bacterium]
MSPREGLHLGTRAVHAGLPEAVDGEPFLPGPVFASAFHLSGPGTPEGYGRYAHPTMTRFEEAVGVLEGGAVLAFGSGMAATSALLLPLLAPGDVLVACGDAYPGVRRIATEFLEPRGVEVRLVPSDEAAIRSALPGSTFVWVETPSNPGLDLLDLEALAVDVHGAGARLAVDNTLATPYLQRPLEAGADFVVASGTKALTGHSDLIIGYVAAPGVEALAPVLDWRGLHGAIPGPFETWLAHRSLSTLGVRIDRQQANAEALRDLLAERSDVVGDVRWPGMGGVLCFTLGSEERAEAFLAACTLVADATSFGGVHSTAERRARWGTDDVAPGFVRFSCGVEDTADLVADVERALEA